MGVWVLLVIAAASGAAEEQGIFSVKEVRPGQKGYGLTVFQGAAIEPFAVEVISVEHGTTPGKSVVWVRCPEERMQKTGPVQGMSGSPIYLWDQGEAQELGKGGRLLGAFAFGFGMVKECLVGVQPIEHMLEAAERAKEPAARRAQPSAEGAMAAAALLRSAQEQRLHPGVLARLSAVSRLLPAPPGSPLGSAMSEASALPRGPRSQHGAVSRMLLPLSVPGTSVSPLLEPLLRDAGLTSLAAGGKGLPPGIDPRELRLLPGSVLAVPLVFGDIEMAAVGTVTTVLPDGRVLGFGHPMFGQGELAVPMAGGYVHMVVPLLTVSFKLGGSGPIHGALVRDEQSAVVGRPDGRYHAAAVSIAVDMPRVAPRRYDVQLVHHQRITPMLLAMLAGATLSADHVPGTLTTLRTRASLRFTGQREIAFESLWPSAAEMAVVGELAMLGITALQNPFEDVALDEAKIQIEVEPVLRAGTVVEARLRQAEVAPGSRVAVSVKVQPYNAVAYTTGLELTLPQDLPEGDYPLVLADAATYMQSVFASQPHRWRVENFDQMLASLREVYAVRSDALYLMLQRSEQGLAVGRREMPQLPSSRRALIASPTSTLATPYVQWITASTPTEQVVSGSVPFTLTVRRQPGEKK